MKSSEFFSDFFFKGFSFCLAITLQPCFEFIICRREAVLISCFYPEKQCFWQDSNDSSDEKLGPEKQQEDCMILCCMSRVKMPMVLLDGRQLP